MIKPIINASNVGSTKTGEYRLIAFSIKPLPFQVIRKFRFPSNIKGRASRLPAPLYHMMFDLTVRLPADTLLPIHLRMQIQQHPSLHQSHLLHKR